MLGSSPRDGRVFRLVVVVAVVLFLSNVSLLSVHLPGSIHGSYPQEGESNKEDDHDSGFNHRLTEFTQSSRGSDAAGRATKIADSLRSGNAWISNNPGGPSLPLALVVGLPKSGTTSVYEFFRCSGFKTSHYCCCGSNNTQYPCSSTSDSYSGRDSAQHQLDHVMAVQIMNNLRDGRPMLANLGDFNIHAQLDGETHYGSAAATSGEPTDGNNECIVSYFLPQHYHLDELHDAAPNSIWILSLRRPEDWAKSVIGWLDMAQRILESDFCYRRKKTGATAQPPLPSSYDDKMAFLIAFYESHTQKIRDFVKNNPSQSLIEVDISSSDAGMVLARKFQAHHAGASASCWSRQNSGPFFTVTTSKNQHN